jgi:hypothetical protein
MALSETLTHILARILRPMSIAARESPKTLRCGLMKAGLLRIVLSFRATAI